jgi:DNA-binding response OmpR family regulator
MFSDAAANDARRILVVEDQPLIGLHLKDCLERAGYDVVWVQTDRGAYTALNGKAPRFEVLILDVDLGQGTTGFDIARFARKGDPEVGIVFASGSPPEWIESFGVDNAVFVPKPTTEPAILAALALSLRTMQELVNAEQETASAA